MGVNVENYRQIREALGDRVQLVAVSKLKSVEEIKELYDLGQRDFGENYVQELLDKQVQLPADIRWHFIGHLQSNKVRFIAPFIHLIHGVDSMGLLKEVDKQGRKVNRIIQVLLQVHIAQEKTKYGLNEQELNDMLKQASDYKNVHVIGLMGMASFTEDLHQVRNEFRSLKTLLDRSAAPDMKWLSMGMSGDYQIAIEEGSNMVRIGSLLFGPRMKET